MNQVKHHDMKGILFKEPLFHKTIAGLKTETRRVIKADPLETDFLRIETPTELTTRIRTDGEPVQKEYPLGAVFSGEFYNDMLGWFDETIIIPRYNIGEVAYIKEPMSFDADMRKTYKYDTPKKDRDSYKWSNKLFMKATDARYHIKILDIKVERIFNISEASVKAEGVDKKHGFFSDIYIDKCS